MGATIVACSAEVYGGRTQLLPLALALGCTLMVGYSLAQMPDVLRNPGLTHSADATITVNWLFIGIAILTALFFTIGIGPGLPLSSLSVPSQFPLRQ